MSRSALVLLAPGFEEIEATCPIDLLRRAEVQVTVAAVGEDLLVTGRSELTLHADCLLPEVLDQNFDLLVLPGGPAVFHLREQPQVLDLIRWFQLEERIIGAICAAPLLLLDAGLLPGPRYTAHGSVADELPDLITDSETITEGTLITSRGAGTAVSFGLALVRTLCGPGPAEAIRQSIHASSS
jgi:4-methyl-5(b-hydroxyethyl)-thiazole monophosphate biosynthesis